MQREPLRDRARGRWAGMLPLLGVPASALSGKHGPCPMCGGRDRFRFDNKEGAGTWICSQCGAGDGFGLAMAIGGYEFAEAARRVEELIGTVEPQATKPKISEEDRKRSLNRMWRGSRAIKAGDPVGLWLQRRLRTFVFAADLRFAPSLRHEAKDGSRSEHPGMVAMVRDRDGTPVTLHRTYLTKDGDKAPVDEARKLMAGQTPPGSSVRLGALEETLGVAEGIETALAASALFGLPVWAAINTSILKTWNPPAGVSHVVVFGDHDTKFGGQAAAFALAHRLACDERIGVTARVEMPELPGEDWNDVLLRRAG